MKRLLAIVLFVASVLSVPAATWYVDKNATGNNTGTSWMNAYPNLLYISAGDFGRDSTNVAPGDVVEISGGDYTNTAGIYLHGGTVGNWITYQASQAEGHNSEVVIRCTLALRGYLTLSGAINPDYATNILCTYDVTKVTNNCNLHIDLLTDPASNNLAVAVIDTPVLVKWVHATGQRSIDNAIPGSVMGYLVETENLGWETAYCWIDGSPVHGAMSLASNVPDDTWGRVNVHHSLFEHEFGDNVQLGSSMDYHHNIVRDRGGDTGRGGCNDGFQADSGFIHNVRIYNNVIEPLDNTLISCQPGSNIFYNFCFYGNVIRPVNPVYSAPDTLGEGAVQLQNGADIGAPSMQASNVFFLNNTVIMGGSNAANGFISLINNSRMLDTNIPVMTVLSNGFIIKNNLLLRFDAGGNPDSGPLGLYGQQSPPQWIEGWHYGTNDMVVDYNMFWTTNAISYCGVWKDLSTNLLVLTNAARIAFVTGHSNNISDIPVLVQNESAYDYRPVTGPNDRGVNLLTFTNLMPDLDKDVYGHTRGVDGAWDIGAIEGQTSTTNGLIFWLNFADDGWPTNGVIADRSGALNNAYRFSATNWPTWTNGPGGRSAAQFVTNYSDGTYTYGTYAGVTNFNSGLDKFTNGTWACWAWCFRTNENAYNSWLNVGYGDSTWAFGTYYDIVPTFRRNKGGIEGTPDYLVVWPTIETTTNFNHYAVTWDGTNFIGYYNGAAYQTNGLYGTNSWTGTLVSSNAVGSWMGVGVATHDGTPWQGDDAYPNHGQFHGQLADVRIYNRALSAAEVMAIYTGTNAVPPTPPELSGELIITRLHVGTLKVGSP